MQIGFSALLDTPSYNYVRTLQVKLKKLFQVKETLKLEPHFTIKYAFETNSLDEVEKYFDEVVSQTKEFEIEVKGIDYFDNEVVILDISKNEFLSKLHLKILKDLAAKFAVKPSEFEGENFNFHITLAYKDISEKKFQKIKGYLKTENPKFKVVVKKFALYLLLDPKDNWFIYKIGKLR